MDNGLYNLLREQQEEDYSVEDMNLGGRSNPGNLSNEDLRLVKDMIDNVYQTVGADIADTISVNAPFHQEEDDQDVMAKEMLMQAVYDIGRRNSPAGYAVWHTLDYEPRDQIIKSMNMF